MAHQETHDGKLMVKAPSRRAGYGELEMGVPSRRLMARAVYGEGKVSRVLLARKADISLRSLMRPSRCYASHRVVIATKDVRNQPNRMQQLGTPVCRDDIVRLACQTLYQAARARFGRAVDNQRTKGGRSSSISHTECIVIE